MRTSASLQACVDSGPRDCVGQRCSITIKMHQWLVSVCLPVRSSAELRTHMSRCEKIVKVKKKANRTYDTSTFGYFPIKVKMSVCLRSQTLGWKCFSMFGRGRVAWGSHMQCMAWCLQSEQLARTLCLRHGGFPVSGSSPFPSFLTAGWSTTCLLQQLRGWNGLVCVQCLAQCLPPRLHCSETLPFPLLMTFAKLT